MTVIIVSSGIYENVAKSGLSTFKACPSARQGICCIVRAVAPCIRGTSEVIIIVFNKVYTLGAINSVIVERLANL